MFLPKLKTVDDIAALPWGGNYELDAQLFEACDKFIATLTDKAERDRAEQLVSWHGMGERA